MITLSPVIDSYLARLTLAGYRPRTIGARRDCLRAFVRHLGVMPIEAAARVHVESYLARPLAPESRRAYRSHLKSFYAWALEEGLVAADPTERIPAIRVPRAVPRPVGDDDLARALAVADPRMRAWLLLMALAGLRCCEVAGLAPPDLTRTEAGWLLYLRECKGGGAATMPAHPTLVTALLGLPVHAGGTWWTASAAYVSRAVSLHLGDAGVNATAHQIRHFAGTSWFRASGHDLLTTATLLRHASVQTPQIYAALDPVRPAEVVGLVRLVG